MCRSREMSVGMVKKLAHNIQEGPPHCHSVFPVTVRQFKGAKET